MLRELATRWPANGNLAERIVAEAIVEHLLATVAEWASATGYSAACSGGLSRRS